MGVARLAAAFAAGRLLPSAAARHYLARIEQIDPALNAYLRVEAASAIAAAEAADRRYASGAPASRIDGVPIALKDNIDMRGLPTTNGQPGGPIAREDAEVVRRLRAAGAVFLGKLNLHECALGATTDNPHYGATRNPWAPERTPGGSSGGSAAAVAAGLCAGALGTDTMGSVRLPAAYCGVVGFKPTQGLVSLRGVAPLSYRLDHVGTIARNVEDAALLLDAIAGEDPADPMSRAAPRRGSCADEAVPGLGGVRIAVIENLTAGRLEPPLAILFETALARLEAAGGLVERISVPGLDPGSARRAGLLIVEADGAVAHALALEGDASRFSPEVRALLEYPGRSTAIALARAERQVHEIGARLRRALAEVDLAVAPTAAETAFLFSELRPGQADLTAPANFAGVPALSLPCGLDEAGLPFGLQLLGPAFAEPRLVALARAAEAALAFRERPSIG